MARKLELGQKSIVDAIPNNGLDEVFEGAEYPMEVVVTNHMPREISLPELGLFLGHVANPDGSNKQAAILSGLDQLRRVASSIEQISMLNGYEFAAITIEQVAPSVDQNGEAGGEESNNSNDSGGSTDDSGDASKVGSSGGGGATKTDANETPEAKSGKTAGTSKKHKGD